MIIGKFPKFPVHVSLNKLKKMMYPARTYATAWALDMKHFKHNGKQQQGNKK